MIMIGKNIDLGRSIGIGILGAARIIDVIDYLQIADMRSLIFVIAVSISGIADGSIGGVAMAV